MARGGISQLCDGPVVEEEVDLGEALHEALVGALVAGRAVRDKPLPAAGLAAGSAGDEGLPGPSRAVDDLVEGLRVGLVLQDAIATAQHHADGDRMRSQEPNFRTVPKPSAHYQSGSL